MFPVRLKRLIKHKIQSGTPVTAEDPLFVRYLFARTGLDRAESNDHYKILALSGLLHFTYYKTYSRPLRILCLPQMETALLDRIGQVVPTPFGVEISTEPGDASLSPDLVIHDLGTGSSESMPEWLSQNSDILLCGSVERIKIMIRTGGAWRRNRQGLFVLCAETAVEPQLLLAAFVTHQ